MNNKYQTIIGNFNKLKVLVIGEMMIDNYIRGTTKQLCREAPVPVVNVQKKETAPGGAANTAVNIQTLGAQAYFVSVGGDDQEARKLLKMLRNYGVNTKGIILESKRETLVKNRVIADSQILVRFDEGTITDIEDHMEKKLISQIEHFFLMCDAVVISDYGYGILTKKIIDVIKKLQTFAPKTLIVDSKFLHKYRKINITALKPNYEEATKFLGLKQEFGNNRVIQMMDESKKILEKTNTRLATITVDSDGAIIMEKTKKAYHLHSQPVENSKAAGAGDTFTSVLALTLALNVKVTDAVKMAQAASSIVVRKEGTSSCFQTEIRDYFLFKTKELLDLKELNQLCDIYRQKNKKIVFTNGCFDIIHPGHISYLKQAKALGDILIVGINSDGSIRRIKGKDRPINTLKDRIKVLSALSSVDQIVPFEENTPINLIKIIRPDIYVKGADYTKEKLPETPVVQSLGGKIAILPYVENHSTTNIIKRIKNNISKERFKTVPYQR